MGTAQHIDFDSNSRLVGVQASVKFYWCPTTTAGGSCGRTCYALIDVYERTRRILLQPLNGIICADECKTLGFIVSCWLTCSLSLGLQLWH